MSKNWRGWLIALLACLLFVYGLAPFFDEVTQDILI